MRLNSCKLESGSRQDKTQFTPHFETGQNCKKTKHVQFLNVLSPTVSSCLCRRCELGVTQQHCTRYSWPMRCCRCPRHLAYISPVYVDARRPATILFQRTPTTRCWPGTTLLTTYLFTLLYVLNPSMRLHGLGQWQITPSTPRPAALETGYSVLSL